MRIPVLLVSVREVDLSCESLYIAIAEVILSPHALEDLLRAGTYYQIRG